MHPGRHLLVQRYALPLAVVVFAGLHLLPGPPVRLHTLTMMAVTCGGTVLHVVHAIRSRGHARRVWSLGAAGLGCWAYAEVMAGIETMRTGVIADRGLAAGLLNLLALCFAFATMLAVPAWPRSVAGRIRMLLDGLIAAAALFGVVWVLVLAPMISVGTNAMFDVAYPVVAVAVLAVGVVLMAGTRRRHAGAMIAITGGVLVVTVALLVDLAGVTTGNAWLISSAQDVYIAAAALLAIAPRFPLPRRREDREWHPGSTAFGVLPYLPMAGYLLVCLVPTFAGRTLDRPALWAGTVLVCAVLTRQFLTIRRNIALSRDLAEQRARYAHDAAHDSLTGLPNRARLNAALDDTTGDAVLLMIDLDGFKAVNDALGHAAGDQLLVVIAERLRAAVPADGALCARLGGDEFAVLLRDGGEVSARHLARTLLDRCAEPVPLDGRVANVRASIGIAAGRAASGLLREADLALYEAKHAGKGQYRVFDQVISAAAEAQRRLEAELGQALADGDLRLLYRPVVDLGTGVTVGVEQLLTWHHPRLGVLAADAFLPAAADAGLLPEIDRWVLTTAVADLARWRASGSDNAIGLRLSSRYLSCGTVADDLSRVLAEHGQVAAGVYVRIDDGNRLAELAPVLAELRALGVGVVLESFGVTHSAVVHLPDLQVDVIELHPVFLTELGSSRESAALLGAVIARAEGLGLICVAGGVERPADAEHLRRLGCRAAKGPLFGAPVPAGEVSFQAQIEYA